MGLKSVCMDVRVKLSILADAAKYDASCASSGSNRRNTAGGLGNASNGICHSYTPDGRCVSLLKILLTNHCIYDCQYCINRITSDVPRARFAIDEVVDLTIQFYKRNYIEGLFLSSGIIQSPDYTMEQLVEVVRRLREVENFNGYVHLKAVPGASEELMAEAGKYADRVSANIELPTQADLDRLAPQKTIEAVDSAMQQLAWRIAAAKAGKTSRAPAPKFAPAGQSTQMIVGATPSTDSTILSTATQLYSTHNLRRVYYTAFSPIPHADNRLPTKPAPLVREHRLYQADWLMRFYDFSADELTTQLQPDLDLKIDPKLAWALRHREFFPVDVNRDERWRLLRIPGLGVRNVKRILQIRRHQTLRLEDLAKLGASMAKISPWVITLDHNPHTRLIDRADLLSHITPRYEQLNLFATASVARSGEL